MKNSFLKLAFVAIAFFFVSSFQTIEANEKVQQRSQSCYDAYQLGGDFIVVKCYGCSNVARVKNVANPSTCGGGGGQNQ